MKMNLVDRIAVTATLAVTILILAAIDATAKAEMVSLSVVAPFAVPPTISMPCVATECPASTGSISDRRCL